MTWLRRAAGSALTYLGSQQRLWRRLVRRYYGR